MPKEKKYEVFTLHEKARGCGFRTSGAGGVGIYLIGGWEWEYCERLPFPLRECPTCGWDIKFSRGWTWITPGELFDADRQPICDLQANPDHQHHFCRMCVPPTGRHGLLWVGKRHYSPSSFKHEAVEMGISRKISLRDLPKGFEFGKTWVYLAHLDACNNFEEGETKKGVFMVFSPRGIDLVVDDENEIPDKAKKLVDKWGNRARIVRVIPDEEEQLPLPEDKDED